MWADVDGPIPESARGGGLTTELEGSYAVMLGMSLATLTALHVVLSLVGMLAGAVVVGGLLTSRQLAVWWLVFLSTTALTSITGFFCNYPPTGHDGVGTA
jgi:hypothetical protein